MVDVHRLTKIVARPSKRKGRGYGSGKGGHTSTRGQKGQKARGKMPLWFEGGQLPLIKRLPFWRGKGKFKPSLHQPIILNLRHLNLLPAKSIVTPKLLIDKGLIPATAAKHPIKILGDGQLDRALQVALPTSKAAAKAIAKAGGKVIAP